MQSETWKVHPRHPDYAISDAGRVKRLTTGRPSANPGRILKAPLDSVGYRQLNLSGKHYRVHTLVLETFVALKQKGYEARHLNGNRADNRLTNLAWGTSKDNSADAIRHGTQACGERQGTSKLKEQDVMEIRRRYIPGIVTQHELAKQFSVSPSRISYIVNRINWKHL